MNHAPAFIYPDTIFEVQRYHKGRWDCLSSHVYQTDAIDAGKQFAERHPNVQVRVIQQTYDPATSLYFDKVLYRSSPAFDQQRLEAERENAAQLARLDRAKKARQEEVRRNAATKAQRRLKQRRWMFWIRLVFHITVIFWGALGAIYILNELR